MLNHAIRLAEVENLRTFSEKKVAHSSGYTDRITWSEQNNPLFGVPAGTVEISDASAFSLVHPEDRHREHSIIHAAIENAAPFQVVFRVIRANDQISFVMCRGRALTSATKRPTRIFGTNVDVTDVERAQEVIRDRERRYRTLSNTVPALTWCADGEGNILDVNDRWTTITGHPKDAALSLAWTNLIHPDDRDSAMDKVKCASLSGLGYHMQNRLRVADGSFHWFETRVEPLKDESGKVLNWYGAALDIDATKRAGNLLSGQSAALRLVAERADLDDVFKTLVTTVEEISDDVSAVLLLIHPQDQRLRVIASTKTGKQDVSRLEALHIQSAETIESRLAESSLSDGGAAPRRPNYIQTIGADAEISGAFALFINGSRKATEDELRSIESAADLARVAIEQLTNVIGEILDVSKVEAERIEISYQTVRLQELVDDVRAILHSKAEARGIGLEFRIDSSVPETISTDPTVLKQILINLAGNAIKFTEHGLVNVEFENKNTPGFAPKLSVTITDTGIGVHRDNKERIFEPFVQADSSMARRYGGTGLGLSISRRFARAFGGDLVLDRSDPGKGSRFKLTFLYTVPATESTATKSNDTKEAVKTKQAYESGEFKNRRILIVDDSSDNLALLLNYLKDSGAEVETARNGRIGTEKALQGKFDVVLMDIQMPEMDGYEATRLLRHRSFDRPIVALTAHALKEEQERARENGFDAYVTKPITKAVLRETLRSVLH